MLSPEASETYLLDAIGATAYPPAVTFAELVKTLRGIKGWSQIELARRADLDPQTIHRIEHGRMGGGWKSRHHLARAFGVSLDELSGAVPTNGETKATVLSVATLASMSDNDLFGAVFAIVGELERRGNQVHSFVRPQNKVGNLGQTPIDGSQQQADTRGLSVGDKETTPKEPSHDHPVPERDSIREGRADVNEIRHDILTRHREVEKRQRKAARPRPRQATRRRRIR